MCIASLTDLVAWLNAVHNGMSADSLGNYGVGHDLATRRSMIKEHWRHCHDCYKSHCPTAERLEQEHKFLEWGKHLESCRVCRRRGLAHAIDHLRFVKVTGLEPLPDGVIDEGFLFDIRSGWIDYAHSGMTSPPVDYTGWHCYTPAYNVPDQRAFADEIGGEFTLLALVSPAGDVHVLGTNYSTPPNFWLQAKTRLEPFEGGKYGF